MLVATIQEHPEDVDEILEKDVKGWGQVLKTPEEVRRFIETLPEQAVIETVACPACNKPLLIDWITRKVRRKADDDMGAQV